MQTRFKDGSVMVVGGCSKDAELEYVGQDGKRICKLGLAVGKREDGSTIWVNVVAWHDTAEVLASAQKGQQVLVIGQLKQREYNGKTYTDLVADFVSVCAPAENGQQFGQTAHTAFRDPTKELEDLSDDSGSLPF